MGNEKVYYWSGAHIGVEEILAGGVERIDEASDDAGWPLWQRARCKACGAVWHFDFSFPDHPPLFLVGKVVDSEEEVEGYLA